MRMLGATGSPLPMLVDLTEGRRIRRQFESYLDHRRAIWGPEEVVESLNAAAAERNIKGITVEPRQLQVLCTSDVKNLVGFLPLCARWHDVDVIFELTRCTAVAAN